MARLSLFRPNVSTIKDAERVALRWFSIGFVMLGSGFVLTFVLAGRSVGPAVLATGAVIGLGTVIWVALATRYNTVRKTCPRCSASNAVFRGENYFRCAACGFFAVLREM